MARLLHSVTNSRATGAGWLFGATFNPFSTKSLVWGDCKNRIALPHLSNLLLPLEMLLPFWLGEVVPPKHKRGSGWDGTSSCRQSSDYLAWKALTRSTLHLSLTSLILLWPYPHKSSNPDSHACTESQQGANAISLAARDRNHATDQGFVL